MADEKPGGTPSGLSIEIDDDVAQGVYANLALITHSETEFVMDFIFQSPHPPKAKVRARIVTNPAHMKGLAAAMQENVARYEARFGPIKPRNPGDPQAGSFH